MDGMGKSASETRKATIHFHRRGSRGYGEWVQLSVFQCRYGDQRHAEMQQLLDGAINSQEDHILIVDIGPADRVQPRFTSLGKGFDLMERGPIVI